MTDPQIATLRTCLTEARIDVLDTLRDCLKIAEKNPQSGVAVVMLGEGGDDTITTAYAFRSRLELKGALMHAIGELD